MDMSKEREKEETERSNEIQESTVRSTKTLFPSSMNNFSEKTAPSSFHEEHSIYKKYFSS